MGVEDPFDCTDNCSRTFLPRLSSKAAKRFADAAAMLQKLDQPQGALLFWHLLALLWLSRLVLDAPFAFTHHCQLAGAADAVC